MANQPPVRPWLRLGSIRAAVVPPPSAPPPEPQPQPQPQPRTIMSLPTFRTASAPPSPQTQPRDPPPPPPPAPEPALRFVPSDFRVSAPSSPTTQQQRYSAPSSPVQKPFTSSSSLPSSPSRKPTTLSSSPQSPRAIKETVQSPKRNPSAPPPSPLTLPPSQVKTEPNFSPEAEPKTVLVQKTVAKPRHYPNGETGEPRSHHGKHFSAKEIEASKEKGIHKKVSESEESGMRVITIAGENRGAYMELIQSQKKKHEPNYLHKNKEKGDKSGNSSSSDEGNSNKNKGKIGGSSSLPLSAYMNSNVQCVNNSLLYHTSCSHHDPGVRLSLTKKPFGEGYHLKESVDYGHDA